MVWCDAFSYEKRRNLSIVPESHSAVGLQVYSGKRARDANAYLIFRRFRSEKNQV